jgi:hypothetical protein
MKRISAVAFCLSLALSLGRSLARQRPRGRLFDDRSVDHPRPPHRALHLCRRRATVFVQSV